MSEDQNLQLKEKFSVSQSALTQIGEILAKETSDKMFRIAVNGGGCSGFQYEFVIDDKQTPNDVFIGNENAKIVIDELSLSFLENGTLDWTEELIGSAFKIKNPNARTSCGCGMSFSV